MTTTKRFAGVRNNMFLMVFLRYFLGLLLGDRTAAAATRFVLRTAKCRSGATWASLLGTFPHDWVSVDYALTESSCDYTCRGRGTFEKASQLLRWRMRAGAVLPACRSAHGPRPRGFVPRSSASSCALARPPWVVRCNFGLLPPLTSGSSASAKATARGCCRRSRGAIVIAKGES